MGSSALVSSMNMEKTKATMLCLAVLVSAGLASAEDVMCSSGEQMTEVVLQEGDDFTFSTTGRRYRDNMNCTARYTLAPECEGAEIICTEFHTRANRRCSRGDYLAITDFFGTERYCRRNGPYMYEPAGDFTMEFVSDERRRGKGLSCYVGCPARGSGSGSGGSGEGSNENIGDCKCGLAKRATRIVGGQITEVNEYPWQVGLVSRGSNFVWCGGALISDQWILTAAHCVENANFQVLLGEHDYMDSSEADSIRSGISAAINHPRYDASTTDYDFSLVKLSEPVDFSQHPHIRPICLPADDSETYADFDAIVTGWGTTSSGGSTSAKLREVVVQVLSNEQCRKTQYASSEITDQMLCAGVDNGGKDACQGDSGGPLITSGGGDGTTPGQNYEHIGVVSWGIGCALADYPGIYARTTTQLSWIDSITGSSFNTCPRE